MSVQVAGRDFAMELWPQSIREFEALVEEFQDRLVHFAFCRLGNIQDAEDVVQEVFVRAYADREKLRSITWVGPYLFRMAGNRCTDVLRKQKRAPAPLDESSAVAAPAGETSAWEQRRIERLLSRLPDREAEVLRLRAFGDLQFAEIAEVVGRPVPTVKSRFRYGIEKLRKILAREGITK